MLVVLLVIAINAGGFFAMGGALHWWYYGRQRQAAHRWKHQPRRFQSRDRMLEKLPLVLLNALIINAVIGVAVSLSLEGRTQAYWDVGAHGVGYTVASTVALGFFYHFALYYFHKAMHQPRLYKLFHRLHHKYKTPMFLDALYEHPLEALYGGLVISAPLFLFPVWGYGFLAFLAVVGVHEVIDHSGVDLNVPLLSRSKHHDDHHLRFHCYYGQLLPLLDDLHGTGLPAEEQPRPA